MDVGRIGRALATAGALLLLSAVPAAAAVVPVQIQFQAFAPPTIDVLLGDSVQWTNSSERTP